MTRSARSPACHDRSAPARATGTGRLWGLLVAVSAALLMLPDLAWAQQDDRPLVRRYQAARYRVLAQQILDNGKGRLPAFAPVRIPTPLDTLTMSPEPAPDATGFTLRDVRVMRKLERSWFDSTFAATEWAYLGLSRDHTFIDTTQTRDLRARLQAVFGSPTQTLGDFDLRTPRSEYVQFEYWFVVNGDVPVKVSDMDGPRGRGLVVSTDARYRDSLHTLRGALLEPLRSARRAPYVDYYYDAEAEQWYRTGFDGTAFFRRRTRPARMTPAQRPRVEAADPTAAPAGPAAAPDTTSTDPTSTPWRDRRRR